MLPDLSENSVQLMILFRIVSLVQQRHFDLFQGTSQAHICVTEAVDPLCDPGQLRSLFTLFFAKGASAPEILF